MAEPSFAGRRLFTAVILLLALAPAHAAGPGGAQPSWADLPAQKQQILAPLAAEWDKLEPWRQKKWLEIAEGYPRLGADEQGRVQRRMKAWIKLTPEERKAAREKYRNVQQATPAQREALKKMWTEYQSLPDEEKLRLKQSATLKVSPPAAPGTTATPPLSSTLTAPTAR